MKEFQVVPGEEYCILRPFQTNFKLVNVGDLLTPFTIVVNGDAVPKS